MFDQFIENSNRISLNFNSISSEVRENISESIPYIYKKINAFSFLRFAVFLTTLCVVAAFISVSVTKNQNPIQEQSINSEILEDVPSGAIDPGILDDKILVTMFDVFVSFGEEMKSEILFNSNIISDDDISKLKQYLNANNKNDNQWFNIHIGIKDGKDVIYVKHLSRPYNLFMFDSNLDYEFQTIIDKFELLCGETLTQEFLMEREFDNALQVSYGGIDMFFKDDGVIYVPYYILNINGKSFVLDL